MFRFLEVVDLVLVLIDLFLLLLELLVTFLQLLLLHLDATVSLLEFLFEVGDLLLLLQV